MSKQLAELNDNCEVINVIIVNDDFDISENFIEYTKLNPAYIGGDYYENYFYAAKPFMSWSRDGKGNWIAPTSEPNDGKSYVWDEASLSWMLLNAD